MQTLILAFILMLLVFGGMAIGVMVQRKSIAGSCGGIGALGMEKACDCDNPCDKKLKRMGAEEKVHSERLAKEQERLAKEKAWQEKRIH
ncbi:(Na+)-NQR maturation NqrM [Aliidiomarina celeris]|uniref:(Na+)-NQR maturation NqrM n=1 Tax=Aliidiomarina celeris TaxID=2249428 RepID=UPI000DEB3EEF|nr:(Na+)-NQR maturation NqrM [Aliidiomarina celeris]